MCGFRILPASLYAVSGQEAAFPPVTEQGRGNGEDADSPYHPASRAHGRAQTRKNYKNTIKSRY